MFFFSPIINKNDRRANFLIKRFNAPSFFACALVTLSRKSIWHDLTVLVCGAPLRKWIRKTQKEADIATKWKQDCLYGKAPVRNHDMDISRILKISQSFKIWNSPNSKDACVYSDFSNWFLKMNVLIWKWWHIAEGFMFNLSESNQSFLIHRLLYILTQEGY